MASEEEPRPATQEGDGADDVVAGGRIDTEAHPDGAPAATAGAAATEAEVQDEPATTPDPQQAAEEGEISRSSSANDREGGGDGHPPDPPPPPPPASTEAEVLTAAAEPSSQRTTGSEGGDSTQAASRSQPALASQQTREEGEARAGSQPPQTVQRQTDAIPWYTRHHRPLLIALLLVIVGLVAALAAVLIDQNRVASNSSNASQPSPSPIIDLGSTGAPSIVTYDPPFESPSKSPSDIQGDRDESNTNAINVPSTTPSFDGDIPDSFPGVNYEARHSSKLQVQIPASLYQPGGYEHREALFGIPPYGGSIAANMYYAADTLCDFNSIDTTSGYPIRAKDSDGNMLPWQSPYILMVDRGDCTFVKKVRNAQMVGAAAVIIADNSCLCPAEAEGECRSDPGRVCEAREPIMADDGSGSDVSIPSFLMTPTGSRPRWRTAPIEMTWSVPKPDDRVEYELWTTPADVLSREFKLDFEEAAVALGKRAYFTPQMYIFDGIRSGCQGIDGESQCYNLCTNNGRYCASDPDNDLDRGVSGADVVAESLRRMCIWIHHGQDDGVGVPWWDYVSEFELRCNSEEYFSNDRCIADAMDHSSIDGKAIDQCMDDSGGLEGDVANQLLESQLVAKDGKGVVVIPAVYVNGVSIRGSLDFHVVFEAICAGYATGAVPSICAVCDGCVDQKACVANRSCGSP
ncbi:LOW QUALITY PROTEIN: hypothetical protein ACHAWF_011320 [Thalassiosira exigua]